MQTSGWKCIWGVMSPSLITGFLLVLLLFSPHTAFSAPSRNESSGKSQRKPYTLPTNVKDYLRERYPQLDVGHTRSTLRATPDGPLGEISLRGRIMPVVAAQQASAEGRARASALAFL